MTSTCPICFDDLDGKEKASPDACEHIFCLLCLEKWSKLGSYCPVDRKRYKKIVNLDSESVIQVKPRKRKRKRIVYDFSTTCEICDKDDDPNTLLLCDCCDLGYHCHCLTPPLEIVPAGLWFCPTCVTVEEKLRQRKGITKEMELDYDIFLQKLNYYQPALPQAKKQKILSPHKSGGAQNTFDDIISVFEDINVVPDSGRNVRNDLNVSIDYSEMDKMLKTFNFISETKCSTNMHVEPIKTYMHVPDVEVSKPSLHNSTQDENNISELCKRNLENNIFCYLSHSTACSKLNCTANSRKLELDDNVKEPSECKNQNKNLKEGRLLTQLDSQNSVSEIVVRHNKLSLNRKKHSLCKNSICKEDLIFKEVNDDIHDDTSDVHNPSPCASQKFPMNDLVGGEKIPYPDLMATLETDVKTPCKSSPEKAVKVDLAEHFRSDLKLSTAFRPVVMLKKISILDFFTTSSPGKNHKSSNKSSFEDLFSFSCDDDGLFMESVANSEVPDENYNNLICGSGVCDSPVTPVLKEHFPSTNLSEIRTNISLNRCEMCSEVIFRSFNGSSLCKICKRSSSKSRYDQTFEEQNSKTYQYSINGNETFNRNLFAKQTRQMECEERDFISPTRTSENYYSLQNSSLSFIHNSLNESHKSLQSNNYETLENTSSFVKNIKTEILDEPNCFISNESKSLDLKNLKNHLIIRSDGSLYLDYKIFEGRYVCQKNITSEVLEEPSCSSVHNESKSFYLSDLRHHLRIRGDGSFYLDC